MTCGIPHGDLPTFHKFGSFVLLVRNNLVVPRRTSELHAPMSYDFQMHLFCLNGANLWFKTMSLGRKARISRIFCFEQLPRILVDLPLKSMLISKTAAGFLEGARDVDGILGSIWDHFQQAALVSVMSLGQWPSSRYFLG